MSKFQKQSSPIFFLNSWLLRGNVNECFGRFDDKNGRTSEGISKRFFRVISREIHKYEFTLKELLKKIMDEFRNQSLRDFPKQLFVKFLKEFSNKAIPGENFPNDSLKDSVKNPGEIIKENCNEFPEENLKGIFGSLIGESCVVKVYLKKFQNKYLNNFLKVFLK